MRSLAFLHLYAMYGYRVRAATLPDTVLDRVFTGEPAQKEEKKREKLFVLGVLGDSEHRLEAHHVLGFPHFEGVEDKKVEEDKKKAKDKNAKEPEKDDEKKAKEKKVDKKKKMTTPLWATELPTSHQFAPTTGSL